MKVQVQFGIKRGAPALKIQNLIPSSAQRIQTTKTTTHTQIGTGKLYVIFLTNSQTYYTHRFDYYKVATYLHIITTKT